MAEAESEVKRWFSSISCGLNLNRFAKDFEDRGFVTKESLKYIDSADIDIIVPSPRKPSYAEKKILLKELHKLSQSKLEIPTAACIEDIQVSEIPSTSQNQNAPPPVLQTPQEGSGKKSYLGKKEDDIQEEMQFFKVQIASARQEHERLQMEAEEYDTVAQRRVKTCSNCHLAGHNKGSCNNPICPGVKNCRLRCKHPEVKSEITELNNLIKTLEKKYDKANNDFTSFKAARERASNSFFAVMRPRLKKQNPLRYMGAERLLLDRDLLTLKKALSNKIPISEDSDWRLPYILEEFKRSHVLLNLSEN